VPALLFEEEGVGFAAELMRAWGKKEGRGKGKPEPEAVRRWLDGFHGGIGRRRKAGPDGEARQVLRGGRFR